LAAGIAHEIGNPLASMSSLVQLLFNEGGPEAQEGLQQLWTQIQRMQRRLGRLRDLTRKPRQHPAECDLGQLVRHSLELMKFDPRWKGVKLLDDIALDLPPLIASEDAVIEIVHNLISNALDAVQDLEHPKLRLAVRVLGDTLVLEVEDNGGSIDAEHLKEIFEPFYTTKTNGTGLGLTLTRDLVHSAGGELLVESDPVEGTRFGATFPIIGAQSEEALSKRGDFDLSSSSVHQPEGTG
jgi:signal transduction histidine kinase